MRSISRTSSGLVCAVILCLPAINASAILPPAREELPNLDGRPKSEAAAKAGEDVAVATLKARAPEVSVSRGERSHAKWIHAEKGFLTGTNGRGRSVSVATAAAFPSSEKHLPTKAFVREHAALFGFGPEALEQARVKREFVTPHNGLQTVVWEQELEGISIFDSVFISHTTKRGELVSVASQFVPAPAKAASARSRGLAAARQTPAISAAQAIVFAARNIGEELEPAGVSSMGAAAADAGQKQVFQAAPLTGDAEARLMWVPLTEDTLRLCWDVMLSSRARGEMYRLLVDVETGEVLIRHRLTEYISDASYRVFLSDSPSPFSPSCSTPCTTQPPVVAPVLVTLSALNTNASPNGWIDDGINETRGNNVDAHTDRDANNSPDLPRPQGSPFRTFDFPVNLSLDPLTYTNGAVTDLFYWCNWMHDQLYALGFTEAAGNFQNNNFGRGGLGNDALQADAQDGSGVNNANMSTPSDGSPPRMQMYVFNGPNPDRDGDFDHEIVLHEYTHGLSNRRVGGGVGLSASQSRGMGEGWSDWYGLALLSEPGDDVHGVYAAGAYATYQLSSLTQNYYYGIRRYPYSTDMSKNPLTFKDIDPTQASTHPGVPESPLGGGAADEVHNQGEVWCVTLWEARANLIVKYGHAIGNQLILQLVTDGMNLSPANPNFLQSRDAILQADVVNNGGANLPELWAAFAKRGMGFSATSPSSSTTVGLVEAFDVPDDLSILPATVATTSGAVGGPFSPNPVLLGLTNLGNASLTWSLSYTSAWLTVTPTSGVLTPGGPANTVLATIGPAANSLPLGTHTTTLWFSNQTTAFVQTRTVMLNVVGRTMSDDFDPALDTSRWSAFGGTIGSTVAANSFGGYVSAPNSLWFGDSGSRFARTIPIDTSGGGTIGFSIRLANGSSSTWETADDLPIEGVVMEASTNAGVSWTVLGSYDTTAYYNWTTVTSTIPVNARGPATLFQWRQKSHSGSSYDHWAIDSVSIDATPATILQLTLPSLATEGDLPVSGLVTAIPAPINNLTVALTSSDSTEITSPATVTILAGMTSTNFNVTIVNDAELDGVQQATISATAAGYMSASTLVTIADNETATLSWNVSGTMTEGLSPVLASVRSSVAPTANITVSLSSSDTTELQTPATVILPAGQTNALFSVTVVNDVQIDGPQPVTLTAHVANWTDGLAGVSVNDNEPTNLVVVLPASAREGNGLLLSAGQVRIAGTMTTNLPVSMSSLDPTELVVPAVVTITAGQTNASFNLTIVDDAEIDSSQNVTVTAAAAGFSTGSTNMMISDNESPLEPFGPSPAHLATNVIQTSDLAWQSGAVAGEIITNDVYLGTTASPGPAELLGSTTNTTWNLPLLVPQTTYYWQVVARKAGVTPGPVWQFTTRGVDHFVWDAIPSSQFVSEPFAVTLTAKDAFETTVSNFNGNVSLSGAGSGGQVTNFILGNPVYATSGSGSYTLGYSFTPNTNLNVTHVRSYSGAKVSIWTDAGVLLASQAVSGSNATWTETPLASPLTLSAGSRYRVAIYTGSSGSYYWREDGANTFSHGVLNQSYQASGDTFPTLSDSVRWWFVDLRYTVGGLQPMPISPTNISEFVNGRWSGSLIAYAPNTNLVLRADDGAEHIGLSNPFEVELRNDIAVSVHDAPDPVSLGGPITYAINVTNIGPTTANGVVVTNILSPGVSFVSATVSQGSAQVFGQTVVCNLQTIGGNSSANVAITATTTSIGTVTNLTTVSRSGADPYLANNSAVVISSVQVPVVTINDVSLFESDSGTASAVFTVSVSPAPAAAVTMNFATTGGTAVSGADFIATNGVLNFAIGQTNRSFAVAIVGDPFYELDETYTVNLSSVVNATLADNVGLGTIRNNDAIPMLSIGDVTLTEGNSGTNNAIFPVTLSAASGLNVTVNYSTANGNATSPSDYVSRSGSLTIPAGSVSNGIVVTVNGDLTIESDEVFYVELTSAANSTLLQREGYGLINNDDGLPGAVDHFVWSALAPTQYVGQPFPVTITALDAFENPAVNFNGPALLSATTSFGVTNILGTNSSLVSFPFYTGAYAERTQVIYPAAQLGGSGRVTSIALDVASLPGIALNNWTIRIKPTPLTNYTSYLWESTGWTVVYQTNLSLTANGWAVFNLATPFDYDGTNNLMFDFSFYNSTTYGSGNCRSTAQSGTRTLYYYTSSYGSPLTWSGSSPAPYTTTYTPNLQLICAPGQVIPIQPEITGAFSNGIWSGNVTALAPTTNLVLLASDGNGHTGKSGAMAVALRDDLGVSVTDAPDPVGVGANLTYAVVVTNTGPAVATGVVLTNQLPAGVTLVSVSASQGTITTNGTTLICNLGTITGGGQAAISILVTPTTAGSLTNRVTVARTGPDNYLGNNFVTNVTSVIVPSISISDMSAAEGNSGPTDFTFTLSLSAASAQVVSVNFATANSSALAPGDYASTNGTITFAPGQTNRPVTVTVVGDIFNEPAETFLLNLSGASNANLGDSQGVGTILNDDPLPGLAINDVAVTEGNSGTTNATFNVTLTPASGQSVSVSYNTANVTAIYPADYAYTSGTLFFNPGETNQTIVVAVSGDTTNELNETFSLFLNSQSNATITDSQGLGTILNDDFIATIRFASSALALETCMPTNGAIDPGEGVTINVSLTNASLGSAVTTNLTVTLVSAGGIFSSSGPQNFGVLAPGGGAVTRSFSFTPLGNCGGQLSAVLQLQDGGTDLGTVSFPVQLGKQTVTFAENFDTVTAPTLPAGWTVSWSGAGSPWATTTVNRDTLPNSVYCPDPSSTSVNSLTSPSFILTTTTAQLSFRHSYGTESCCDRCYLQVSVNGGTFLDLNSAGGSFLTNGYLSGGWGGSSGGFITTIARLPASAIGQSVRLRWHFTSDSSVSGTGWYVDSIALSDGYACCQSDDLVLGLFDSPDPVAVGSVLTYSLVVTNPGPSLATGVTVSNLLPAGVTFVSATSSQGSCTQFAGVVTCNLGTLTGGSVATANILVAPGAVGLLTNLATVSRLEADPNVFNNTAQTITAVVMPTLSISNAFVLEGNSGIATAAFTVNLWPPPGQPVSVNYSTTDGTAQAGSDYVATNGTLNFSAGQTNQTIIVQIFGETNAEPNEIFSVVASNAINATLGTLIATGTILDDDANVPIVVGISAAGNSAERNALATTLTNLGFTVQLVNQGQWTGLDVVVSYAGASSFGPSISEINSGVSYVQITDHGSDWTPNSFATLNDGTVVTISLGAAHAITAGLPSSWTSFGFWRYGDGSDFVGWSTDATLPSLASETSPASQDRLLVANSLGAGKAAYIGWNVYGTNAGPNDLSVLRNAILWTADAQVGTQPVITSQPQNQSVFVGDIATFTVASAGTPTLNYQWRKGVALLANQTNSTLTLLNVQTNDAGSYNVVVNNAYGTVTSSNALLTVLAMPPAIASQPTNQIVMVGNPVTFSVTASGNAPLRYQWRKDNLAIGGGTNSNFTISTVSYTNVGSYSVMVSNAYGYTNSAAATLTVVPHQTNISITAFDKGWYDATGLHLPSNDNYLCGDYADSSSSPYRNWFVFNLPAVLPGPVLTVQLRLNTYNITSPTGSETYQLHHVSTAVPALMAGGNGLVSIYNDLADGTVYGSRDFSTVETNQFITMNLNADCITNLIASAGQPFALGGELASLDGALTNNEMVFAASAGPFSDVQLIITLGTSPAQLKLLTPAYFAGRLRLFVTTVDDSPITLDRASNIWVYASTNVALPLSNWTALANAPVLTNGLLRVDGINPTNPPALFFRAIEGSWNVRPLRLHLPQANGNNLILSASTGDGLPLTPIRAAKIRFYSSTNVALPFSAWQPVAGPPTLSNGMLHVTGVALTNLPTLYFRAEEIP